MRNVALNEKTMSKKYPCVENTADIQLGNNMWVRIWLNQDAVTDLEDVLLAAKNIKAFYMRQNDDGKTVRAMDILFPGIGEIVGGSQREERLEKLETRMQEMHIPTEELYWYLDTRRYGACPHAGFGLGFERLVLFVTGMTNIRDVIAFPRTPKSADF